MKQKITIKILNKRFSLEADSPQDEADIRNAAERIDEKYNAYLKSFPDKNSADILSFIALNSMVETEKLRKEYARMKSEENKLHVELENYLDNVDKI